MHLLGHGFLILCLLKVLPEPIGCNPKNKKQEISFCFTNRQLQKHTTGTILPTKMVDHSLEIAENIQKVLGVQFLFNLPNRQTASKFV